MVTQISFKTESELKNAALLKAKSQGLTMRAILNPLLQDYVSEKIHIKMVSFPSQKETSPEVEILKVPTALQQKMNDVARYLSIKKMHAQI